LFCTFSRISIAQPIDFQLNPGVKTEFAYKLFINFDSKKREMYLKEKGESPSIFDKIFSFFSGDFHAADVTDVVFKSSNNVKITSTINPSKLIRYAIGDKSIRRDSTSLLNKTNFISNSYAEKRGDSPTSTARIDYKTMKVNFYEAANLVRTESIKYDCSDMLAIIYEGVGKIIKEKPFCINDSKSIKTMTFAPAEISDIVLNGVTHKARRYYKLTSKNDSSKFEIWLDEISKFPLKYQIGLSDTYAATLRFELISYK